MQLVFFFKRKYLNFSWKKNGVGKSEGTVTKNKAAGCQDKGYQKFVYLRIVFIGTFLENILGKIQSLDQGSIAEKKDEYWNIRGEYRVCN